MQSRLSTFDLGFCYHAKPEPWYVITERQYFTSLTLQITKRWKLELLKYKLLFPWWKQVRCVSCYACTHKAVDDMALKSMFASQPVRPCQRHWTQIGSQWTWQRLLWQQPPISVWMCVSMGECEVLQELNDGDEALRKCSSFTISDFHRLPPSLSLRRQNKWQYSKFDGNTQSHFNISNVRHLNINKFIKRFKPQPFPNGWQNDVHRVN